MYLKKGMDYNLEKIPPTRVFDGRGRIGVSGRSGFSLYGLIDGRGRVVGQGRGE